ncbi:MAG: hypothetical protein KDE67_11055 [Sphingobium sp.]|mgnify:CR=1 FL=1|nr:hypothetical protein [Sphingobium sp.]MCP5399842.1 hypothetical protein [Sphingomonas sp.]
MEIWDRAAARLLSREPSFQLWANWFDRRIKGERAAFDIPGDKGRREDKAILIRLAEATDKDFWGKGAQHVNTTVQGWIDEARERAATNLKPPESNAELPPQNRNALSFKRGDSGRIAIDAAASVDALRMDADARDRHAIAVTEAQAVLDACQGSNAGARLGRLLANYIWAAGESLEGMRPSLFIQHGERLRQELAAYDNVDNDHPPLPSTILTDLKGWRSAHNMVAGLDPTLMALDTARLGPDVQSALISPDEVRSIARDADTEGVLEDGVREVIEEAADNAPDPPVAGDRRTVWSVETVTNLVIELFAVALNHPGKSAAITAMGVAAVKTAGAATILGAWPAAHFLMKHRKWIETRLSNSPTWRALFVDLCQWIEQNTPIKPRDNS